MFSQREGTSGARRSTCKSGVLSPLGPHICGRGGGGLPSGDLIWDGSCWDLNAALARTQAALCKGPAGAS